MAENDNNNVTDIGSATASGGSGGGGNFGERLARLEEKINHVATSKDISDLKEVIANNDSAIKDSISKNTADLKDLIIKNDTEVRKSIHKNELDIEKQRNSTLKWGFTLVATTIIAIAVAMFTLFNKA